MNRRESLLRLLDSIIAHTSVPWEFVASDASDEPSNVNLPEVRILPEMPRLGCTKGFNRAFREAHGEFVIWINDDAEVCPGYDTAAIEFMQAHPQIGLGALHYSEGGSPFHINSAWGVPYANFGIIRRSLGNEVGWFDEDLEMYGCDNSLAFRVLMAGHGIADIPGSKIIHHSEKDQLRLDNQRSRLRDNETLSAKYMPYRSEWLSTFNRFRIPSAATPWSHGRRPESVER